MSQVLVLDFNTESMFLRPGKHLEWGKTQGFSLASFKTWTLNTLRYSIVTQEQLKYNRFMMELWSQRSLTLKGSRLRKLRAGNSIVCSWRSKAVCSQLVLTSTGSLVWAIQCICMLKSRLKSLQMGWRSKTSPLAGTIIFCWERMVSCMDSVLEWMDKWTVHLMMVDKSNVQSSRFLFQSPQVQ